MFQVQAKISTVRPVFLDYHSVSNDYDNTKSEKYHIKDEKTKSLKKITVKLNDDGINKVNEEMIDEKTVSFRSYYCAGKGKRMPPKVVELAHRKFTQALGSS